MNMIIELSKENGIRISLTKDSYISPHYPKSTPHKNEIGYIHIVDGSAILSGYAAVLNVDLDTKFRNKGFGKQLYLQAIKEAKKLGYKGLVADECMTEDAFRVWKSLKPKYLKGNLVL